MPRGGGISAERMHEAIRERWSCPPPLVLEGKAREMVSGALPAMLSSSYRLLLRLNSRVDPPQKGKSRSCLIDL